jgi:hypothetical protein
MTHTSLGHYVMRIPSRQMPRPQVLKLYIGAMQTRWLVSAWMRIASLTWQELR